MSTEPSEVTAPSGAERRHQALRTAARARTDNATSKANKGIRTLIRDGGRISFSSVARASGVSTKFLHSNEDLAERIRSLATQQRGGHERTHETTATGDNAIIAALRRRLREEQECHRKEISALRGKIAEQERQIAALYGRLP